MFSGKSYVFMVIAKLQLDLYHNPIYDLQNVWLHKPVCVHKETRTEKAQRQIILTTRLLTPPRSFLYILILNNLDIQYYLFGWFVCLQSQYMLGC